jgi:hypothetical protein
MSLDVRSPTQIKPPNCIEHALAIDLNLRDIQDCRWGGQILKLGPEELGLRIVFCCCRCHVQ